MRRKQSTYRLLSSFLIVLTTSLLVLQVVFAVFKTDNQAKETDETTIEATQTEAILPVVVLPFCKAIFSAFLFSAVVLLVVPTLVKQSKQYYLLINVNILGSICMNGP